MMRSRPEANNSLRLRRARWFGSFRILPDGRMRFSPWSYVDLEHVSLKVVTDGTITVLCAGTSVMYLFPERNRILSACFLFDLTPEQLRMAVATLRNARHGLDSWVVPALEYNFAKRIVREDHPETFEVIPELLAACRDLPIAPKWRKGRIQYFINQGVAPPNLPAEEDTSGRMAKTIRSRKRTTTRNKTGKTRARKLAPSR